MSFRTVLVLRPGDLKGGGGMWVFLGLVFLGWLVIRSDDDYKTSEEATREASANSIRNELERLQPKPKGRLLFPLPDGSMDPIVFPWLPITHRPDGTSSDQTYP